MISGGDFAPILTQVAKLNRQLPNNAHGHIYINVSLLTGMLLGIIIYGTAVWAG
jgi:hypothetical protein